MSTRIKFCLCFRTKSRDKLANKTQLSIFQGTNLSPTYLCSAKRRIQRPFSMKAKPRRGESPDRHSTTNLSLTTLHWKARKVSLSCFRPSTSHLKKSLLNTSCPSKREVSRMCSCNKKAKICNDPSKYQNSVKNQFFIMPIYRRMSERSCSNLLEIFFIRTSFSFSSMFDSGECGRNVEGVVFFI